MTLRRAATGPWLLTLVLAGLPGVLGSVPDAESRSLYSSPLRFELTIEEAGRSHDLVGDYLGWMAGWLFEGPASLDGRVPGCRRRELTTETGPRPGWECTVRVLRLAQFGSPSGRSAPRWLLTGADEREPLAGTLTAPDDGDGRLAFPATLRLAGRLRLQIETPGLPGVRSYLSRGEVVISGQTGGWPPYTEGWPPLSLTLYMEGEAETFDLEPSSSAGNEGSPEHPQEVPKSVTLVRLVGALGTQPSDFFALRPHVVQVRRVVNTTTGAGAEITWSDTGEEMDTAGITHFQVYRRRASPDDEWRRVAQVPAATTRWVDDEIDATATDEDGGGSWIYRVSHGCRFVFGHLYEGLPGTAVGLEPASTSPIDLRQQPGHQEQGGQVSEEDTAGQQQTEGPVG